MNIAFSHNTDVLIIYIKHLLQEKQQQPYQPSCQRHKNITRPQVSYSKNLDVTLGGKNQRNRLLFLQRLPASIFMFCVNNNIVKQEYCR